MLLYRSLFSLEFKAVLSVFEEVVLVLEQIIAAVHKDALASETSLDSLASESPEACLTSEAS